jgi:hypothetical protein
MMTRAALYRPKTINLAHQTKGQKLAICEFQDSDIVAPET